ARRRDLALRAPLPPAPPRRPRPVGGRAPGGVRRHHRDRRARARAGGPPVPLLLARGARGHAAPAPLRRTLRGRRPHLCLARFLPSADGRPRDDGGGPLPAGRRAACGWLGGGGLPVPRGGAGALTVVLPLGSALGRRSRAASSVSRPTR